MLGDLRDIFFCIVERNGSDLVWLFRGSLQQLLPSVFGEGSNEIGRSQQY